MKKNYISGAILGFIGGFLLSVALIAWKGIAWLYVLFMACIYTAFVNWLPFFIN